jgi:hypothetical protein
MAEQFTAKIDTDGTQKDFYLLNMLTIADDLSTALVMHEYVNSDGAFIQNMGNHPRTISFKTFWYGHETTPSTDFDPNFDNHYLFLEQMSDSSVYHTFIHPKYGTLQGYISSLRTLHTDVQDYVEIDIEFTRKDIQSLFFSASVLDMIPVQTKALNNLYTTLNNSIAQSGYSDVLNKIVSSTEKMRAQFSNISQASQAFLEQADRALDVWDGFLDTVTQPFNALNNTISFVNDVPGRIIGAANNAIRRSIASMSALNALPVQVTQNLIQDMVVLGQTISSPSSINVILNSALGNCGVINITGAVQSSMIVDDNNAKANEKIETSLTFDPAGNRIVSTQPVQVMSLQDLENMLYAINQYIQSIINLNRANGQDVQDLLILSKQITTFVDTEKLNRKAFVNVTVPSIPLHLLITTMGLNYNAIDRVLKINSNIKNPTFSEGALLVYAE